MSMDDLDRTRQIFPGEARSQNFFRPEGRRSRVTMVPQAERARFG